MHFMPFLTRSSHISSCLPTIKSTITTFIAINIVITIILPITPITASIGKPDNILTHHSPSLEDLQKEMIVKEFKKRILTHMGWSELPKFTGKSRNITQLRELHRNEIQEFLNTSNQENAKTNQNTNEDQHSSKALTFRLIPSDKRLKVSLTKDNKKSSTTSTFVHFTKPKLPDLDNQHRTYSLQSAILHMRFRHFHRRPKHYLLVKVYLINQHKITPENTTLDSELLQSFFVNPNKLSKVIEINVQSRPHLLSLISKSTIDDKITVKLTVTELKSPFINRHRANAKLFKSTKYSQNSPSNIIITPSMDIKLIQKDSRKTRSRRSTRCSNSNTSCCNRKSIYIDFEDIGIADWVLAPQGYTAFYCKGLCPAGFKPARAFSRVKARIHEQDPTFPAPKCASSNYAPLRVMHMGDMDTVEWISLSDMIVTECSCY